MQKFVLLKFIFFFLCLPKIVSAQFLQQSRRDSMRICHNTVDTNYVSKYPDRFIFTLSQSYRNYEIRFTQTLVPDTSNFSAPKWIADANVASSASIDFDKFSISFGLKTLPSADTIVQRKGKTTYQSFSFSFSLYRFRVESSYRNYHGFYDSKSSVYDTSFNTHRIFVQNPSMNMRSLLVKSIFIFNKNKFSYNSSFYNTARQLKSAASFLIVSSIYSYQLGADTSLIPKVSQPFYNKFSDLNFFNANGFSIGPGYAMNLVLWKTLYFNATISTLFDMQQRYYSTFNKNYEQRDWRLGFAGDLRLAVGLNGKRFFYSITSKMDSNSYLGNGFVISPRFISAAVNIGYRFPVKQREWIKKVKANKWYQLI
ncbi:MAG: DUF4421 domain-containing protein [Bacteroidetes bacterium]|nr:DUF4421 domain-containing protein [Bacteroidota bacterium]